MRRESDGMKEGEWSCRSDETGTSQSQRLEHELHPSHLQPWLIYSPEWSSQSLQLAGSGCWPLRSELSPGHPEFSMVSQHEIQGDGFVVLCPNPSHQVEHHQIILVLSSTIISMQWAMLFLCAKLLKADMQQTDYNICFFATADCFINKKIMLGVSNLCMHPKEGAAPWHQEVHWAWLHWVAWIHHPKWRSDCVTMGLVVEWPMCYSQLCDLGHSTTELLNYEWWPTCWAKSKLWWLKSDRVDSSTAVFSFFDILTDSGFAEP